MSIEFDKPSEALATIPAGAKFQLQQYTGGRPQIFTQKDGTREWDAESFLKAKADGLLPKGHYTIKPIISGKKSSKSIKLDLSMDEESLTVQDPNGVEIMPGHSSLPATAYLQESVVDLLAEQLRNSKEEIADLRDELKDEQTKNTQLQIEVARLKVEADNNLANQTIGQMATRAFEHFVQGPGGMILAQKLIGNPAGAEAANDALKAAALKAASAVSTTT